MKDILRIGELELSSRLVVGTGKYRDLDETRAALEASGAQMSRSRCAAFRSARRPATT